MKRIGKIVTAVGVVTALLAGCCLDSQDVYGYLAGAVCIIGGFLGGAGYPVRNIHGRKPRRHQHFEIEVRTWNLRL